jgi:hypothetical protein
MRRARVAIGLFNLAGRVALGNFERRTGNAVGVNRDSLRKILKLNGKTLFGRRHGLDRVAASNHPLEAFRKAVPLMRYDDYAGYIAMIENGRHNVLASDPVDIFAGSSGTTDVPKRLPSTKRSRSIFMSFVPLVQQGVLNRDVPGASAPRRGINLMSLYSPPSDSGPPVMSAINAGVGDIRKRIPALWTSPVPVFDLRHQPTMNYLHALFGLIERDALYISGIFAPQLVAWFSLIERYQDELVRDIATGTLSEHLDLSGQERKTIELRLDPDPGRAAELSAEFSLGFAGIVPRIWPDMKYFTAITTGSFAIYVPRLSWLTDERIPVYSSCHGSSEALVGMNLHVDGSDYVLACGAGYFEFIPLEESDRAQPDTRNVDELRIGADYEIALTSFAGLYRYRLGDIIRVKGFHGTAPVFEFLYRKDAILNLVGEKMTEHHTAWALTTTLEHWFGRKEFRLIDYSVAARFKSGIASYAFYIELGDEPHASENELACVAADLDDKLCKANSYYLSNGRSAERLGPVSLNIVRPRTFSALNRLQDTAAKGTASSQLKTPRHITRPEQLQLLEAAVVLSASGQAA